MLLLLTRFRLPLKQWMARNGDLHMVHKKCMTKIQRGKHIDKIFYSLFIFFFCLWNNRGKQMYDQINFDLINFWKCFCFTSTITLCRYKCIVTFYRKQHKQPVLPNWIADCRHHPEDNNKRHFVYFFFAYWFRYENLYSWTKHGLLYFFSCLVL